jgi:hypothetical protein
MVASRQLLLLLKNKTANTNTQGKTMWTQRAGMYSLTHELDLLCTLYGSSCSTGYELNLFSGGNNQLLLEKIKKNGNWVA